MSTPYQLDEAIIASSQFVYPTLSDYNTKPAAASQPQASPPPTPQPVSAMSEDSTGPVPPVIVTTLGSKSTNVICPHCHAEIYTAIKNAPSRVAYVSGFIIFILGGWMGCCLIPCCIKGLKNVKHSCPNCKAFLGKYRRG